MRVEVLTDLAGLRGVADEWRALPLPTPMQSPEWLVSWWEAYGEDDPRHTLATLAVRDDDGRLAGLAPWYTRRSSSSARRSASSATAARRPTTARSSPPPKTSRRSSPPPPTG